MKTGVCSALAMVLIGFATVTTSCNRSEGGTGRLHVKMMDAPSPYDYDAIYLDVIGVEVNVSPDGGSKKWISLATGAGVYDMLTLVNGSEVILANEEIPAGKIQEVRLILGDGNTIVVQGVSHELVVPSSASSGLKIKVDEIIGNGSDLTLMLDFDAAHSINKQGNGGYHLKPVIRGMILEHRGSIHGTTTVTPGGSVAVIADMNVTSTYTTYTDRTTGEFLLRGLLPGTYTVRVYYPDSDHAVVFENIVVSANTVTELQ
jgi:hypothetical protein